MRLRNPSFAAIAVASLAALTACDDDGGPAPITTVPGTEAETTTPGSTEPASTAPGSTEPTSSMPASTEPSECDGDPTAETASELVVGLSEADAEDALDQCDWILRVTRMDGEDLPATLDLRPNRVNVEVTDGVVTAVLNIG